MPLLGEMTVRLGADISQFTSGVGKAKSELAGLKDGAEKSGGGIRGMLGNMLGIAGGIGIVTAAGAAFGALTGFVKDSVQQASDAQKGIAQTAAVIKSTGGIAGVTAQHVDDLSNSLSGVTTFSDDTVRSTENMILTFTNIGSKGGVFDQTTKTALDMAQALGTNSTQAAMMLGKALNDPAHGMSALQRVGVTFTQSQKDAVAAMLKTGDTAGAQAIILKELHREFGGSAEAAGNTFAGKMAILNNKFDQTKEAVGNALIPIFLQLMTAVQPLVSTLGAALPVAAQTVSSILSGPLGNGLTFVKNVISGIPTFLDNLKKSFESALGPDKAQKIAAIKDALSRAGEIVQKVAGFVVDHFAPAMSGVAFVAGLVVAGIADVIIFIQNIQPTMQKVGDFFVGKWNDIKAGVSTAIDNVKSTVSNALASIQNTTQNVLQGAQDLWNQWQGVIYAVAGVLAITFGPTVVMIGAQAVTSGAQIAASFVANIIATGTEAVTAGALVAGQFVASVISAGTEAVISGAKAAANLVPALIDTGIQAAKSAATLTTTLVPALISSGVQFAKMAAESVASATTSLAEFAAKGYIAAGAMLGSVIPAVASSVVSFVTMAATGVASAIAGFIAYIPVAFTAAAATLAVTWPILLVIAAIGLLVIAILWAVAHWKQITAAVGVAISTIKTVVGNGLSAVGGFFHNLGDDIGKAVDWLWKNTIGKFTDGLGNIKNLVQDGLNNLLSFWKNLHFQWPHIPLPHFSIQGSFSLTPPSTPHLAIDWYATGGIFNGPQIVGVGEAGPEAVAPISELKKYIGGGGHGGYGTANIYVMVDGHTLATVLGQKLVDEARMRGAIRTA